MLLRATENDVAGNMWGGGEHVGSRAVNCPPLVQVDTFDEIAVAGTQAWNLKAFIILKCSRKFLKNVLFSLQIFFSYSEGYG